MIISSYVKSFVASCGRGDIDGDEIQLNDHVGMTVSATNYHYGVVGFLPADDEGRCLLELPGVEAETFVKAAIKMMTPREHWQEELTALMDFFNEIKVYRDDEGYVRVRLGVDDLSALRRLLGYVVNSTALQLIELLSVGPDFVERVALDCSSLVSAFRDIVLRLDQYTDHQKAVLKSCDGHRRVHFRGVAGCGKTFIALNEVLKYLDPHQNEDGGSTSSTPSCLFICRTNGLAYWFANWLCRRVGNDVLHKIWFLTGEHSATPRRLRSEWDDNVHQDLLVFSREDPSPPRFGLVVVDEAHAVLRMDKDDNDALRKAALKWSAPQEDTSDKDGVNDGRLILLSDLSQSEVENDKIAFPKDDDIKEVKILEVCRSTKRLAVAAMLFQSSGDIDGVECSHDQEGPYVRTVLFRVAVDQELLEVYAEKVWLDLKFMVVEQYPGIDLHTNMAIMVPHLAFRAELVDRLEKVLEREEAVEVLGHRLRLVAAKQATRLVHKDGHLRHHHHQRQHGRRRESWIIVDGVSEMEGLECPFVMLVGLDQEVKERVEVRVAQSLLYRGVTRCQLGLVVMNVQMSRSLLEFLCHVNREEGGLGAFEFDAAKGTVRRSKTTVQDGVKEEMKKTKKDVLGDASSRDEVSTSSESSNPTRKRRRGEGTHAVSLRAVRSSPSSPTRRDPSRLTGRQDTAINNDNDEDDGLEWLPSGRPSVVTFGDMGVFDTAGNDALDGLSYFSGQYVPSDVETVKEWRVADMPKGRYDHTAVALKDGRVLVVGGVVDGEDGVEGSWSVLSYDPHSNLWSDASDWPSLNEKRRVHATVLRRRYSQECECDRVVGVDTSGRPQSPMDVVVF